MRNELMTMLRSALCGLALAASGAGAGMAADLVGKPAVVDGDTIDLAGHRLRLAGIDAPEAGQTCRRGDGTVYSCGQMATFALAGVIETQWVSCRAVAAPREQAGPREEEAQRRGGTQAVCRIGPYDVGAEMVRRGWAVTAPGNGGAYAAEQDAARAAGAGLWQGPFDMPWVWRRQAGGHGGQSGSRTVPSSEIGKNGFHATSQRWPSGSRK